MKRNGDVIIVGGGVIGLTTAYLLARENVRVILCEQGKLGMEASWAGAGILPPSEGDHLDDPLHHLRRLSGTLFPPLSHELKERTGIDNGFHRCGGLMFLDQANAGHAGEWYSGAADVMNLSAQEVRQLEPHLAADLGSAIVVRNMAQLRNPHHLQALRAACLHTQKVTFHEDAPVRRLSMDGNRIKEARAENAVLSGDAFVLAAGAWTDRLLEPLGCRLHVEPVRGQIALLNPGKRLIQRILVWGSQYLVPRSDGRVLVGSTEEHAGFEKNTTAVGIQELLALALRLAPCLADAMLEKTWAGLRPASPDGLPFIGMVPGAENLLVAAGHFRAGIQLSPGTALLLKERILQQPLSMPMEAFRLNRP